MRGSIGQLDKEANSMAYITKRGNSYSVRYTYEDEHGNDIKVRDSEGIQLANAKIDEIRNGFIGEAQSGRMHRGFQGDRNGGIG